MRRSTPPERPSLGLAPGAHVAISEDEWFHFLEAGEPLHQWNNVFLVDERREGHGDDGGGACVRAYVRAETPGKPHLCLRLDGPRSERARVAAEEIEAASRALADLITKHQGQASMSTADMAAEQEASAAFTALADRIYAELLGG